MALKSPQMGAWSEYGHAFSDPHAPFLTWHRVEADRSLSQLKLTRGQFADLAHRAAQTLSELDVGKGDRVVHGFTENHYLDLVFRLAATRMGAVPVTVNWEADTVDRVAYKIRQTGARLLIHDLGFAKFLPETGDGLENLVLLELDSWEGPLSLREETAPLALVGQDEKIIIFTSGTTGRPKGVAHTYTSYETNNATFSDFWQLEPDQPFTAIVTSALHHANATAISDWCMRRKAAQIELVSRYNTEYWRLLCELAEERHELLVAPVVSRHFDFLEELDQRGQLPVTLERLRAALARVSFLIGSAPVGPATVRRIQHYCGRLPVVRFGSSETCLQVMGIPPQMSDAARMAAFERGWADPERSGYYIGRPHPGHTEVRIVAGIERDQPGFMADVAPGQPGFLVTRGNNLFSGYVNDPEATARVMADGWYLGLQDIGFCLRNPEDQGDDFYWMSRKSTIIIKGGANYAYDQINAELQHFLEQALGLSSGELEVAVVGLRLKSEHEDETCATIDLLAQDSAERRARIEQLLLGPTARQLTKGARPDRIHFGPIARNFKGAVLVEALKNAFVDE